MPDGLIAALAERQVGRNGWVVMAVLCKMTHANGMLGIVSAKRVSEQAGISLAQVARGMRDLKKRGIIAPIIRKNAKGYRHPDKSSFGHVAQYCICKDVWSGIQRD
ncbi:MAG: hypothetical protein IJ131_04530 [Eggerthellaceae bacterium]|nr:hypothetical protein [Eggerthellaceae bacterium]